MSDVTDEMYCTPSSWPADPESREALEQYIAWLSSSGEIGKELVGDVDLRGATVREFDFSDLWLLGVNMDGVDATGADFTGADLSGAVLGNGKFADASFVRADFTQTRGAGGTFCGAVFSAAQIVSSNFKNADFSGVRLKEVGMLKSDFSGVDFSYSWFGGGVEGCARFRELVIDACNFEGATGFIRGTSVISRRGSRCILSGVQLERYINARGGNVFVVE